MQVSDDGGRELSRPPSFIQRRASMMLSPSSRIDRNAGYGMAGEEPCFFDHGLTENDHTSSQGYPSPSSRYVANRSSDRIWYA